MECIIDVTDEDKKLAVVAVLAEDWCYYETQAPIGGPFNSIEGIIVGLLIDEDDEKIVLAHQWFPDEGDVRHVSVITKSSIKEMFRLSLEDAEPEDL